MSLSWSLKFRFETTRDTSDSLGLLKTMHFARCRHTPHEEFARNRCCTLSVGDVLHVSSVCGVIVRGSLVGSSCLSPEQ